MPRAKAVTPNEKLNLSLHPDVLARLKLHLISEVEGRVPKGDISEFITERLKEFFDWEALDLSLYGFPAGYFVRGPKAMVTALGDKLMADQAVTLQGAFDAIR